MVANPSSSLNSSLPMISINLPPTRSKSLLTVTGFVGQIRPADDLIDDLGGTSLDIMRVMVELERYSGKRLRINDALADTSVAGLARLLACGGDPPAR